VADGIVAGGIVAVAGEALVDLVPAPVGGYLEIAPGGSAANTALGLARLDVPTRMLARIADDPMGRRIRTHLAASGVGLDHVVDAAEPTSLALVTLDEDAVPTYDFRVDGTADWQWTGAELAHALDPAPAGLVHPSGRRAGASYASRSQLSNDDPVSRSYASTYLARVRSTTSSGSSGPGAVRSQPLASSQSRTYCLSNDGCARPGCQRSAGQKREESGVRTSSPRVSTPPASWPSSSLVSASSTPRSAARSAPRR